MGTTVCDPKPILSSKSENEWTAEDLSPDICTLTISRDTPQLSDSGISKKALENFHLPSNDADATTALITSAEWLKRYGLDANHLSVAQILPQIGFRFSQDYDRSLKKPVASRYGEGLFHRVFRGRDGKTYNVSCQATKLIHLDDRLQRLVAHLEARLDWISSGSRNQFGVILDRRPAFFVHSADLEDTDSARLRRALHALIDEQLGEVDCIHLSSTSTESAVDSSLSEAGVIDVKPLHEWIQSLTHGVFRSLESALKDVAAYTSVNVVTRDATDADFKAFEAFHDSRKGLLRLIVFNASTLNIKKLKSLSERLGISCHVYTDATRLLPVSETSQITDTGVNEEAFTIWDELQEARSIASEIRRLTSSLDSPRVGDAEFCFDVSPRRLSPPPRLSEQRLADDVDSGVDSLDRDDREGVRSARHRPLSSREWLRRVGGLKVKGLTYDQLVKRLAFPHKEGFFKDCVKKEDKVINATYCTSGRFAHVPWRDGTLAHVNLTVEDFRKYETSLTAALCRIERRLDWLRQGTRAVFGLVLEKSVYVLIDTSSSMTNHIDFVKERLEQLVEERKDMGQHVRINFVSFGSIATSWRSRLKDASLSRVGVTNDLLTWIRGLRCQGTTNTLAALQLALDDENAEAVYLLTDGRPDQSPEAILSYISSYISNRPAPPPVHAISFNCSDLDANNFLRDLANATGGRFHVYSPPGEGGDEVFDGLESEDIAVLKTELQLGQKYLNRAIELRDECLRILEDRRRQKAEEAAEAAKAAKRAEKKKKRSRPKSASTSIVPVVSVDSEDKKLGRDDPIAESGKVQDEELTSKQWLRRHGLTARRLTLTEVLAPTMVPQVPKWVPILDKAVGSKVFDDFGTLRVARNGKTIEEDEADESGPNLSAHGRLCNPRALSLGAYERKLKSLMAKIESRVVAVAKKGLPDEVLEEGDLKSKEQLLSAVEESGDGELRRELALLENELARTRKFLRRSEEIRELSDGMLGAKTKPAGMEIDATKKKNTKTRKKPKIFDDSLFKEQRPFLGSSKSQSFKAVDRTKSVTFKQPPVESVASAVERSQPSKAPASQTTSIGRPSTSASVRTTSTVRVSTAATRRAFGTESVPGQPRLDPNSLKGQRVIARDAGSGFYYPGVVLSCPRPGQAHVQFDSLALVEDNQLVAVKHLVPVSGAVVCPTLKSGDAVLARALLGETKDEIWIPAKVLATPSHSVEPTAQFHTVRAFSGKTLTTPRRHLRKIAAKSHAEAVEYIRQVQRRATWARFVEEQKRLAEMRERLKDGNRGELRRGDEEEPEGKEVREQEYEKEEFEDESGGEDESEQDNGTDVETKTGLEEDDYVDDYEEENNSEEKRPKNYKDSRPTTAKPSSSSMKTPSPTEESKERVVDALLNELPLDRQKILLEEHQRRLRELNDRLKRQTAEMEAEKMKNRRKRKKMLRKIEKELEAKGEEVKEVMRKEREEEEVKRMEHSEQRRAEDILDLRNLYKNAMTKAWCDDQLNSSSDSDSSRSDSEALRQQRNDKLKALRESLPQLMPATEVVARWDDDGWYYRGKIIADKGDKSYVVADAIEGLSLIWRENILTESDDADRQLSAESSVVAAHPNFTASFAPGVVLAVHPDLSLLVRFFDGFQASLSRREVFLSTPEKFQADVDHILDCEMRLLEQAVVTRDDSTGFFVLAVVTERLGPPSHHFAVKRSDGSQAVQPRFLIFGAHSPRRELKSGDRVLAPGAPSSRSPRDCDLNFLPGWVVGVDAVNEEGAESLTVQRCDGSIVEDLDSLECYWISQGFYEEAVRYIQSKSG